MKIVFLIHCLSWLIQLIFLLIFAIKLRRISNPVEKGYLNGKDVSIVICARNEYQNLKTNFYSWVQQKSNQKQCELIIVNDASSDQSLSFLEKKRNLHPNFKLIDIKPEDKLEGKKSALNKGVMAASGEYIILTDADCKPSSQDWANEMAQSLNILDKKIILGFAPYIKTNSFVNSCVQYETSLTAMLYAGFAQIGLPYMGVGRNMGYKKSFYEACGGHSNHPKNLISGDDDMFINKNATADNTGIHFSKNSLTYSPAPTTFKEWFKQKKRHLNTSVYYKKEHILLLSLFSFSHLLYIGTIFVTIFTLDLFPYLFFFVIRFGLLFLIFKKISNFSNLYLSRLVIINDITHIFYYIFITFYSFIVQKNSWK